MQFVKTSLQFFQATLLAGLVLGASSALAASQCRGIQQDACTAAAECVWVNGYMRKDGRSVSSHCKSKGVKTAASRSDANAQKLSTTKNP